MAGRFRGGYHWHHHFERHAAVGNGPGPLYQRQSGLRRDVSRQKDAHDAFYVVGPNGEFADVVVSLKGVTGKSTGASAPPAALDQKDCVYTPQILAIQTGQKLIVKNSDMCIHNVHSVPATPGNEEHNDVQMSGAADLTYTFPKPELFLKFECNVHPWMKAWVSVFDSPYFAVSDKDGKFVIKNVPPGKYTVEANHRKAGAQTQDVEVADKDVTVNFTFAVK